MAPSDILQLLMLLLMLVISAFFSSAETAMMTVNSIRMRTLAEEGDTRAELILRMTEDPGKMLSAILIGNNIANLYASALAATLTINLLGSAAVGVSTGILTFLVLIFGEVTPKTMASIKAEKLALKYCRTIHGISVILTPLIFLINLCANGVLHLVGVDPRQKDDSMTEEELRTVLDVSHEDGVLEEEEHIMVHNVLDLGDSQAHSIMIPRGHMIMLHANSTLEEVRAIYEEHLFTRYPVLDPEEDRVIGILNIKDLLFIDPADFDIRNYLRDAFFTYEFKNISELLPEMRKDSYSLAIVLDEYGEIAGLLTLEDILEEIVGEIHDEYDEEEEDPILRISDLEYTAEGSVNLQDFSEELGIHLESEDCDSLGGFMIEQLERLPDVGDTVTTSDGIILTIQSMDDKRIDKIRVVLPEKEEKNDTENKNPDA